MFWNRKVRKLTKTAVSGMDISQGNTFRAAVVVTCVSTSAVSTQRPPLHDFDGHPSSMSNQKKYETVASLNYPSYAVAAVGGRHVVVGGGGGSAKTGIKNQFVSVRATLA